jgi:hypothetical protein
MRPYPVTSDNRIEVFVEMKHDVNETGEKLDQSLLLLYEDGVINRRLRGQTIPCARVRLQGVLTD